MNKTATNKYFLFFFVSSLLFTFIFNACRKTDQVLRSEDFSIKEAQEWYTMNYKEELQLEKENYVLQNNTNSENGVPVNFKKINWNTGKSFQKGQLTIIEFSYRGSAIRLDVPDSNYSDEQRRKMSSAILKRVVISKDANNKISMKQVHIVPEYNYLIEKVNFKNESLKNLDKKFSGWLYFYDWLDKPLEVLQFNNGAITKAYKLKNSQVQTSK